MSLLVPERIDIFVHSEKTDETFQTTVLNLLQFLKNQGVQIMTALSDYADKVTAFVADISGDLDSISTQITALQATITTLNNSAGAVTPADQASIDQALAQLTTLAAKADSAAGKTPPPPPAP